MRCYRVLLILTFAVFSRLAAAAGCDSSLSFDTVWVPMRNTVQALAHEYGYHGEFQVREPLTADLLSLQAELSETPDPRCKKDQAKPPQPAKSPFLLLSWNGNISTLFAERVNAAAFSYGAIMPELYTTQGQQVFPFSDVVSEFRFAYPGTDPMSMTSQELTNQLIQFQIANFRTAFPGFELTAESQTRLREETEAQAVLYQLYRNQTDAQWRSLLSDGAAHWSDWQKKFFLSRFGGDLFLNADPARLRNGPNSNGGISTLQLLNAFANHQNTGVCRDIAGAMAQVAEAMGLKDVYTVSYQMVGDGHATVLMRDPSDPSKILKYDYDQTAEALVAGGPAALQQQRGDLSHQYFIQDSRGRTVADIPSDLEIALTEATGGNTEEYHFAARNNSPGVLSARIGGGALQGNLVVGQRSNGERFVGIIPSFAWGNPDSVVSGQGAAGVVFRQLGPAGYDANAGELYIRYTQAVNSPWLRTGDLRARVHTSTTWMGTEDAARFPDEQSARSEDARLGTNLGLEAQVHSPDGKSSLQAEALQQFMVGFADMSASAVTIVPLERVFRVSGTSELTPDLKAALQLAYGLDAFGPQILLQGGIATRDGNGFHVRYEGRLNPSGLAIAPGKARQLSLQGQRSISPNLTINLELLRNFDQGLHKYELRTGGKLGI